MSLNAYDLSSGVFIRGLTNLKAQLTKAANQLASEGSDEATLLNARLAADGIVSGAGPSSYDLHFYTLVAQVHWAAEGARLAIARLLGEQRVREMPDATSLADLHQRLDATIDYLREVDPADLESGLERTIVVEHPRGSISASGSQFLVAYAIPHFFYHVSAAYGIMRNQGVPLTMSDYLGNWGASQPAG